jgi:hypothetical protein
MLRAYVVVKVLRWENSEAFRSIFPDSTPIWESSPPPKTPSDQGVYAKIGGFSLIRGVEAKIGL